MDMTTGLAHPKPRPRASLKAARDRREAKVEKQVRAACVERDGYCRVAAGRDGDCRFGVPILCAGLSQFVHLPPRTRAHTRGEAPEQRHQTAWTGMFCQAHHDRIDGRRLPKMTVEFLTADRADGPLAFLCPRV